GLEVVGSTPKFCSGTFTPAPGSSGRLTTSLARADTKYAACPISCTHRTAISCRQTQPSGAFDITMRTGFISAVILFWSCFTGTSNAAMLAGKQVQAGASVEIQFPVPKYFQSIAAQGGNPVVQTGRAVLMFPPGFDPSRSWPI